MLEHTVIQNMPRFSSEEVCGHLWLTPFFVVCPIEEGLLAVGDEKNFCFPKYIGCTNSDMFERTAPFHCFFVVMEHPSYHSKRSWCTITFIRDETGGDQIVNFHGTRGSGYVFDKFVKNLFRLLANLFGLCPGKRGVDFDGIFWRNLFPTQLNILSQFPTVVFSEVCCLLCFRVVEKVVKASQILLSVVGALPILLRPNVKFQIYALNIGLYVSTYHFQWQQTFPRF